MKSQIIETNYIITMIHEYDHSQYYQGHSDIFDHELIHCIPVAIPFSYWVNDEGLTGLVHETLGELKLRIIQGLNELDFCEYPELREIPDNVFRLAVDETLGDNKFNGLCLATLLHLETNPQACYDEWIHYIHFHIYPEHNEATRLTLEANR